MIWDSERIVAADLETSGVLPEYALQPWRVARGDAWITSGSMLRFDPATNGLVPHLSQLFPTKGQLKRMLEDVLANGWTILGWNIAFDISMLMALGPDMEDLCMRIKWLDGMLLERHYDIEPEYEFQTQKHLKKSYSLKGFTDSSGRVFPGAVQRWIPSFTGLDEDVRFHATDDESLAKLQAYNDRDNVRAWVIAKMIWEKLTDVQQRAALIEAEALPLVAQANLHGLTIDQLTCKDLGGRLTADAAAMLHELAPDGITEEIVRSPTKLGVVMFDEWKLPVLKTNKSKVEGKADSRSTDKEVLHELAFIDGRVRKVKAFREALNAKGKFCDSVLESVAYNDDGCTHPIAKIFGTYTGRMTVSSKQGRGVDERPIGFALHQMKREAYFRETLTVDSGYDMVEFDAAGQEFRWMAIASGDPTMLSLCMPGEDAHSFMGAQIMGIDYRKLIADFAAEIKAAKDNRYLGKFANLCIAEGATILTDRGPCSIEQVRDDDLVWDGERFVAHAGVSFSGVREVMTYLGVTGTPDHKVFVDGAWIELAEAARYGRVIEPALGAGRTSPHRAALRVVDGLVRRAVREVWGTLRARAVRMREGARGKPPLHGDWALGAVQGLCHTAAARTAGASTDLIGCRQAPPEAGQRMVPAVSQPRRQLLSQLWRAWDRMPVRVSSRGGQVRCGVSTPPHISEAGHRPDQQRWSLRAWKLALGYAQGKPSQPGSFRCRTYDIVNCGPDTRFAANGRIVHNSLQYRTSARKLRTKARTDYDIPIELPEAQRIHATYQRSYPGVPHYWDTQIALVKGLGYVETFGGNRIRVVGDWNGTWGWSMGSTAINARIQGTGADQKHLAMAVIKDYLRQIGGRFLFDLHDGLYLAIPSAIRPKAVDTMKHMLDNLPYQQAWGFTPPIPMPWDAKVGKAWGRLKEVHFA